MEKLFIHISKLKPNKLNDFEMSNIEEVKASIKAVGLLTPLSVIQDNDSDTYRIIAGEQRYRALLELAQEDEKYEEVPCYILDDMSQISENYEKFLIETANTISRDVDKNAKRFKLLKILKDLQKEGNEKFDDLVKDFAKYAKVSPRYSRMYISVFESEDNELRDRVKDGLDIKIASRMVNKTKEEQEEFIRRFDELKETHSPKDSKSFSTKVKDLYREMFQKEQESDFTESEIHPCLSDMGNIKGGEKSPHISTEPVSAAQTMSNAEAIQYINENDNFDYSNSDDYSENDYEDASEEGFSDPYGFGFDEDINDSDVSWDTTGRIGSMLREEEKKKKDAEYVLDWCKRMLNKDSLSKFKELDLKAFEACVQVVDKFQDA